MTRFQSTDATTLRAIMDVMKPEKPKYTRVEMINALDARIALTVTETILADRICSVEGILTNLKPSNTKAQLLQGIAEARAILNGDAT